MKYVPLFDNVLVKEIIENEQTIVVYTEHEYGKVIRAEVIETGPGNWHPIRPTQDTNTPYLFHQFFEPIGVGLNEVVYFRKNNAKSITLDNQEYFVVSVRDILVREVDGKTNS